MELLLKYLAVFFGSMAKILLGPAIGEKSGLSFIETCIVTTLGATFSAIAIMYGGEKLREILNEKVPQKKDKKVFTKRSRLIVKVWRRYGVYGIAFLTPVLLSPLGGPIIASVLGAPVGKTIRCIFISCLFWVPLTAAVVYGLFDFLEHLW